MEALAMAGGQRPLMASGIGINRQLGEALDTAIERKAVLRIGWTADGTEVPKDGEGGLCPFLPSGARVRALGRLGAWVGLMCAGSFDQRGDVGSHFAAVLNGGRVVCEGRAGHAAGWSTLDGLLILHEGANDDLGAEMRGGVILARGKVGARVGNGMTGGLIVVHGDVGLDPGSGMKGGMIVVDGRCQAPADGVHLRPLTTEELAEVNSSIDDPSWQVHADAVCLVPRDDRQVHQPSKTTPRANPLAGIHLLPMDNHRSLNSTSVDRSVLLGQRPLALPLPVLPCVSSGERMKAKRSSDAVTDVLANQPAVVSEAPRPIDLLLISKDTVEQWTSCVDAAGVVIDLDGLPPMDVEGFESLLVVLYSLGGDDLVVCVQGDVGRVNGLHAWAAEYELAAAFVSMSSRPNLPVAAMLPMSGRSANGTLSDGVTVAGGALDWAPNGEEVAILSAGGLRLVTFTPNEESPAALASTLNLISEGLSQCLRDLGAGSIDALSRSNLRASTYDVALMSGLRMAGFERPLPEWTR